MTTQPTSSDRSTRTRASEGTPAAPDAGARGGVRRVSWPLVALKELRELMVTGRFQAAAALVFGLIATTLTIMTRSYARALEEYGLADAARLASLHKDGHLNRAQLWQAAQPPNPLSMLVSGLTSKGRLGSFDNDTLAIAYPHADLVVIVGIVLSLVAVLFAHDAFTGERERGTPRLLVSGAASRGSILLGKLVGRYVALLVPLIAGLLVGALTLLVSRDIGWGRPETGAFLALTGISMLFLGVFVALGLVVSAWSRTTHGSLALALAAWGTFLLIIPSVAPYAAAALAPTDNLALHQRRLRTIMDSERDDLIRELYQEWRAPLLQQHPELTAYYDLPEAERPAARAADPALNAAVARMDAVRDSAIEVANARQREKAARISEAFDARRQKQVRLTEGLASLSPYAALVLASLDLTETGPRAREREGEQYRAWAEATYRPWLNAKMDSARAVDPNLGWNSRITIAEVPSFRYTPEPLPRRLSAALPEVGALAGFGALFLLLGFVGFRRYDVR